MNHRFRTSWDLLWLQQPWQMHQHSQVGFFLFHSDLKCFRGYSKPSCDAHREASPSPLSLPQEHWISWIARDPKGHPVPTRSSCSLPLSHLNEVDLSPLSPWFRCLATKPPPEGGPTTKGSCDEIPPLLQACPSQIFSPPALTLQWVNTAGT